MYKLAALYFCVSRTIHILSHNICRLHLHTSNLGLGTGEASVDTYCLYLHISWIVSLWWTYLSPWREPLSPPQVCVGYIINMASFDVFFMQRLCQSLGQCCSGTSLLSAFSWTCWQCCLWNCSVLSGIILGKNGNIFQFFDWIDFSSSGRCATNYLTVVLR